MPPEPIKRDGAGNILTDNRSGSTTTFPALRLRSGRSSLVNVHRTFTSARRRADRSSPYNNRNRLLTATSGALVWGYTYNAREQLVRRNLNVGGTNLTHFVHDIFGNVIAETNGTAAGTTREYIWLPETEIAPTYQATAQVDRPVAVVDGLGGPLLMVHVDHLNRPVKMTNAAKASVWDATWLPWGGAHSITGTATMNARFPGQWFQLEAGLHYNWHRSYDPTIGRYTQPDPLGFVDGPSVYGYAGGSPLSFVDALGLNRTGGLPPTLDGRTGKPFPPPQPPTSQGTLQPLPLPPQPPKPDRQTFCNLAYARCQQLVTRNPVCVAYPPVRVAGRSACAIAYVWCMTARQGM